MEIKVTHSIGDLASDMATIPPRAIEDMNACVRKNVREGNRLGRAFAKESAGSHGKLYHLAWSDEMTGLLTGEWGPDASKPQGAMNFETGSRNQKPHLDAARSADIQAPKFTDDVAALPDKWFW